MSEIDFSRNYDAPIRTTEEVVSRGNQIAMLNAAELALIPDAREVFYDFLRHLELGNIRAAEMHGTTWSANADVKRMILMGFRLGQVLPMGSDSLPAYDKDTYPPQRFDDFEARGIRVLPTASARRGSYIGDKVILMNSAYVNAGAYVGAGTMVDSMTLVGSCAQIGARCHLSAFVGIGGVLEPAQATPCIVEDDVFIGMQSSIAEGVIVRSGAVIAGGVHLTGSTRVWDEVNKCEYRGSKEEPLVIPPRAVVIMAVRKGDEYLYRIKKYRDETTDMKTALESALRD